jgi:hypothetical protein
MTTKRPELSRGAAAIFARLWDTGKGLSVPVARHILKLQFSEVDKCRMHELAQRNQTGTLSQKELDELDNFIQVGDLLGILQSKARKYLKQATARNSNG